MRREDQRNDSKGRLKLDKYLNRMSEDRLNY